MPFIRLSEGRSAIVWQQIIRKVLDPNKPVIEPIITAGDVAVVVSKPLLADTYEMAVRIGWDSRCEVFRMTSKSRKSFARIVRDVGDRVSHDWLMRKSTQRVLLIIQGANFLLNLTSNGWTLEPGSSDISYEQP